MRKRSRLPSSLRVRGNLSLGDQYVGMSGSPGCAGEYLTLRADARARRVLSTPLFSCCSPAIQSQPNLSLNFHVKSYNHD